MCRGLAILLGKNGKIIYSGLSSHSETAITAEAEDASLKYEVIADDSVDSGYVVEIDSDFFDDEEHITNFEAVKNWVKENELLVLRYLLSTQSYARRKKDTDNRGQRTGGNTDNRGQRTGGNTDNSGQETAGDTNNSWQKTGGDTNNSGQETAGDTDNHGQKTGGDTNNHRQETAGDTDNSGQKTGGNTDNSGQNTGGEWFCGKIVLKKYLGTTKVVALARDSWELTLPELLRFCAENPEKVLKLLGEEGRVKK